MAPGRSLKFEQTVAESSRSTEVTLQIRISRDTHIGTDNFAALRCKERQPVAHFEKCLPDDVVWPLAQVSLAPLQQKPSNQRQIHD